MSENEAKIYGLVLGYLARRSRSTTEVKQYLTRKGYPQDVVASIVQRLIQDRYLDDHAFAAQFIQSRIRYKPKSKFALGYELKGKGVESHIIDAQISNLEDMELAMAAVSSKVSQWQHLESERLKKKLMNYLRYRGFDYRVCQAVWHRFKPEA